MSSTPAAGCDAADGPEVTGPFPVPDPHLDLARALGSLWIAVTEAGVRLSAEDVRDVHWFRRRLS